LPSTSTLMRTWPCRPSRSSSPTSSSPTRAPGAPVAGSARRHPAGAAVLAHRLTSPSVCRAPACPAGPRPGPWQPATCSGAPEGLEN
jgi:hypothetical protein